MGNEKLSRSREAAIGFSDWFCLFLFVSVGCQYYVFYHISEFGLTTYTAL